MRLVTVTPAGRRPYLEILANYLLRRRDVIAEHRWWLNTRRPEDVTYIYQLADRYPDFFSVVSKPVGPLDRIGYSIWRYMCDCIEADTIYIRLDDDICYMADDAIVQLRDERQRRREPLLVLGNIVNNAVCSHFHQRAGLLPNSWGTVANDCYDPRGWGSGAFARRVHRRFLNDLAVGRETWWRQAELPIDGTARFSINAISWFGEDFRGVPEVTSGIADEEPFLTVDLPRRLGRPNVVCSQAVFAHYAFIPQRPYLETTSPEILARYRRISQRLVMDDSEVLPFWERGVLATQRLWGVSAWAAGQAAAGAWQSYRRGKQWLRGRRAA
jgi:hypothetical protein